MNLSTCKVMCWNVWSVLGEEKLRNVLQVIRDKDIELHVSVRPGLIVKEENTQW